MNTTAESDKTQKGFGPFEGVFTPTILTILGVIMYLRLGWVVGNAGVGGAILIILLAKIVTVTTGLSIASMATNIKVGAGGSYAVVSRSLGLEVGSAVGIPLYLSQSLGGAMYIVGFTEGWLALFPTHEPKIVGVVVLAVLFTVSMISAKVAMKVQYVIMAVIVMSLVSFFAGRGDAAVHVVGWGEFSAASFWVVFSIFFPAVTGIEAGAAMSGDLKDPSKGLPFGIMGAIGLSLVVYIAVAFWLGRLASPAELVGNYTIMMDLARWRFLIVAGVFGATLSSALGSIVGGPRTLMALAQDRVVPFSGILSRQSANGEPRYAIVVTTGIILAALLLGNLNTIAPVLTMFFLITYGTINLAVLIEQGTGIPSFRPSFRFPIIVPLVGSLWCFIVMMLINPAFAGAAIAVMILVYVIQVKRGLTTPWGDVRRALFYSIAEWAARTSANMPENAKSWKPHLMIPVEEPRHWSYLMEFVRDVVYPGGTMRIFTVKITDHGVAQKRTRIDKMLDNKSKGLPPDPDLQALEAQLAELSAPLRDQGVFSAEMAVESHDFLEGVNVCAQVMRGMFFPPNTIFLTMSGDPEKDCGLENLIAIARAEAMGVMVLWHHPKTSFGARKRINIWLRLHTHNLNLAIIMALQLARNWRADIRLLSVVEKEEYREKAEGVFRRLAEKARLSANAGIQVMVGGFTECLDNAPAADLNVFGLPEKFDGKLLHNIAETAHSSCLFVMDSGQERAWE